MKSNPLLLLALGALALAGCSSTPTKVSSGTIHAKTFSFVNRGGRPEPVYADNRQGVHKMIQSAITKNLTARGVSRVSANGDVTVAYLVITGNNISTTTMNDYFGYHADTNALHEKAHEKYTAGKNPNAFEAGTLVIDIVDGKSFKLLRRGHATRSIRSGVSSDARAARIQEVVDEILRDVRFVK